MDLHKPHDQQLEILDIPRLLTVLGDSKDSSASASQANVLLVEWNDYESLTAVAANLTKARFVCIHSSAIVCEQGLEHLEKSGVDNVRVLHASVEDLADDFGDFDCIAADRFYSYAVESARQSLWRVAQGSLRYTGLLFVSYDVLPGAAQQLPLRDFAQLVSRGISDPTRRLDRIWSALEAVARLDSSGLPLAAEAARLLSIGRDAAMDADLHPGRCAFRLREVVDAAVRANLRYVGELSPISAEMQPGASQLLDLMTDFSGNDEVERQEMLDILTGNSLRNSLFTPTIRRGHSGR